LPNDLICEGGALDVLIGQRVAIETGKKNKWLQKNSIFAYEITKEQIAQTGDYSLSSEIYRLDNLGEQGSKKYPLVEMKDICAVDWGNTNLTKSSYVENGKYLAVSAAGCDGRINEFEHEIGVIVLSAIGANCGRIFYPTENFTAIKNTITFTPDREKILPKYLFYIMRKNELPRRGGAQPFMSKGDVEKYKIPLPPLEIQKEIVEQIDTKQEAIEHAKAIIKNLERERRHFSQSLRNLDCKWVELGEISERITKGTTPTTIGHQYQDMGINFIKIESITETGNFIPEKFAHITEKCHQELKRSQLKENDILFSIAGALGRVAIVSKDILPANTNQALAIISLKKDIYPQFILSFLKSSNILEEVGKLKTGVAQSNLSLEQVSKLKVPLPSLDIQERMVEEAKEVEKIINVNYQLLQVMEGKISAVLNNYA
jgi:restriction endonuclease S subunit